MFEGDNPELQQALQNTTDSESADEGALTDQLVAEEGEITVYWTCGNEVEREAIDETFDSLRSLRQEKSHERNDLSGELDELTTKRSELQSDRDRRERLERDLDEVEREIDDRESTVEKLTDEREQLEDEIDEREAVVENLEDKDHSELLDLHKDANHLKFELGQLENDLENVTDEIKEIEADLDERERLEEQRDDLQKELADLRTRIEQLEAQAVEEFNEHMQTILGVLEYENIERIWIERAEREAREGRRKVQQGVFDLYVVRSTEDGTTYEDTVEHLSESEREVTGLVFALAGYLVHDLYETLPFMVVDSLEALDPGRIAALVEYFEEYAEYLVVALLPEDAAALDDKYQRVTDI
jgi:DNA repair exonuclease SbcCD ATPase subunit